MREGPGFGLATEPVDVASGRVLSFPGVNLVFDHQDLGDLYVGGHFRRIGRDLDHHDLSGGGVPISLIFGAGQLEFGVGAHGSVIHPDFSMHGVILQGMAEVGFAEVGNQVFGSGAAFYDEGFGERGALGVGGGLAAGCEECSEKQGKGKESEFHGKKRGRKRWDGEGIKKFHARW